MYHIHCPNCGERDVKEFHYGGERLTRPVNPEGNAWSDYLYKRDNTLGVQKEWWYHRLGCRRWFVAERHTRTHEVEDTYWFKGSTADNERE